MATRRRTQEIRKTSGTGTFRSGKQGRQQQIAKELQFGIAILGASTIELWLGNK